MHDIGAGQTASQKMSTLVQALSLPIATYQCPSRRQTIAYQYVHGNPYQNVNEPTVCGRSDYAANGGDTVTGGCAWGPGSISAGDAVVKQVAAARSDPSGNFTPNSSMQGTGVNYLLSTLKMAAITDGASRTIMIGEKVLTRTCTQPVSLRATIKDGILASITTLCVGVTLRICRFRTRLAWTPTRCSAALILAIRTTCFAMARCGR